MKSPLQRILLFLLVAVLSLFLVAAAKHRVHLLPPTEVSELFTRYKDTPGIEAAFFKDYRINDTLSLDMTLLVAKDSSTFAGLLKQWGRSDEFIQDMMSSISNENTRFIKRRPKGHPELPADADDNNNEVVATFPGKRAVAFFHTANAGQIDATEDAHLYKRINI